MNSHWVWLAKQMILWLYTDTSGQHITVSGQWRVRPLSTVLQCHLLEGLRTTNRLFCFFKNCFQQVFFCLLQKIQRHYSTGAASTVQGRLLCRVRWIQSSSWPDWGYHRDVCSVGLKDQHSLPRNTRVQGTGLDQQLFTALFNEILVTRSDTHYLNTSSFCNLFSLWRTKYYKSTGNTKRWALLKFCLVLV